MIQQSPTEERAREIAHDAAWKAINGSDGDPHQNPESYDFCCKVADAIVEALTSQAAQPAEADGVEPFAWMLRHKTTGEPYWDEDMCVWSDRWDAEDRAEHEDEYEAVPVFAATPKAPATDAGEVERARLTGETALGAYIGPTSAANRKYPDAADVAGENFTFLPINRPINFAALATPPAPNDDLRAALEGVRAWAASLPHIDMNEIVADNGITAGMVVGQEAAEQVRRIDRALKENRRG